MLSKPIEIQGFFFFLSFSLKVIIEERKERLIKKNCTVINVVECMTLLPKHKI
jgi:hypothetical protein